jgi:hypothetical protein
MILTPARRKRRRGQVQSRSIIIPSPIGGWNARDSIADMPATDAVILDNWYPSTDDVRMRSGHSGHVTGITGSVESLMPYSFGTTQKLFAAANNSIYDVTAAGAVGSAAISSLTNNRWQSVNFGTSGGNFLFIVNGADSARHYNGSSWATPTITGLTSSTFINVNAHNRRLFFCIKNTLKFGYMDSVESVAGAASSFDLSGLTTKGGSLVAMGTWTIDGGSGVDDFAVFITSEGELIVYKGTDPGTAANWTLAGVYHVGRPVGSRCFMKLGGDLVIITEDGFIPLSKSLISARATDAIALSDKISGAVNEVVEEYKGNFGWQAVLYPKKTMAIFNVPIKESVKSHQYVVNTTTGAWCRFTGQNASCWAVSDGVLYFGGSTKVFKSDTGQDDDGNNIDVDAQQAFSYFTPRATQKHFRMVRPIISSTDQVTLTILLNVDFKNDAIGSTVTSVGVSGSTWDVDDWDVAEWGSDDNVFRDWLSATGIGSSASLRIKLSTKTLTARWAATDFLYASGGYL